MNLKTFLLTFVLIFSNSFGVAFSQGHIELISKSTSGLKGNDISTNPSISSDGNVIAFKSLATNLSPNDSQSSFDVDYFIRNRAQGITFGLFATLSGQKLKMCEQSDCEIVVSGNGGYVAFISTIDQYVHPSLGEVVKSVFRLDLTTGQVILVSQTPFGNPVEASDLSISFDGNRIAYLSYDSNIVPNDTNNQVDVFVYDVAADVTLRASVASNGAQANSSNHEPRISSNGQFVVFTSTASSLVGGDVNVANDIFLHNIANRETRLISRSFNGTSANGHSSSPSISSQGGFIAFASKATNIVSGNSELSGVFIQEVATGVTTKVGRTAAGYPIFNFIKPTISGSNRYVAFLGDNPDLPDSIHGANEVYVYDRVRNMTVVGSLPNSRGPANGLSQNPVLSHEGNFLAFDSTSSNFLGTDVDGINDVYAVNTSLLFPTQTPNPNPTIAPTPPVGSPAPNSGVRQQATDRLREALVYISLAKTPFPKKPSDASPKKKIKAYKEKVVIIKLARFGLLTSILALEELYRVQPGEVSKALPRISSQKLSDVKQLIAKASKSKTSKAVAKRSWSQAKSTLEGFF